jgi:hypothetical protein
VVHVCIDPSAGLDPVLGDRLRRRADDLVVGNLRPRAAIAHEHTGLLVLVDQVVHDGSASDACVRHASDVDGVTVLTAAQSAPYRERVADLGDVGP